MTIEEAINLLNTVDESDYLEAKTSTDKPGKSFWETVCAFSNTSDLGGGHILCGIRKDENSLWPSYTVVGVNNPDQFLVDVASGCANPNLFNRPVRVSTQTAVVNGKHVVMVSVPESSPANKPLFLKKPGLPGGAFIRVGSADLRCTVEDIARFMSDRDSYDEKPVNGTKLADVDATALERYRTLRSKVNPSAEILHYNDTDLLQALGCMTTDGSERLTVAGVLLFGSSMVLRRKFPMHRVDYIRVPGNRWMEDVHNRFTSVDMRGPLILLADRAVNAIYADLPIGFRLEEGQVAADGTGLPVRALREAIVNALMHRNYRISSPTQFVRYDSRLELTNVGYSLKAEDNLGEPGSVVRNPIIASVFHDTRLAEVKGTGIRAMRRLLKEANLAPPSFNSDRQNDRFITQLLLHHLLGRDNLDWLRRFSKFDLTDAQRQALVIVKETEWINNVTYRSLADCDVRTAGTELRQLVEWELLRRHGHGRGTYYGAGDKFEVPTANTEPAAVITEPPAVITEPPITITEPPAIITEARYQNVEPSLLKRISAIGPRIGRKAEMMELISAFCKQGEWTTAELARAFNRQENGFYRTYIVPMVEEGTLERVYPNLINHPKQAYRTAGK